MAEISIALVGNPNCGKTTLFNALTGCWQRVGNWSGVTVERKTGSLRVNDKSFEIIDLPGTYTLTGMVDDLQIDESITRNFLGTQNYAQILNVVDAVNLERNLYLTCQILEQNIPTIVALNRMDLATERGIKVCPKTLAQILGCEVVGLCARQGQGIEALKEKLAQENQKPSFKITYPEIIETQVERLMKETLAPRYQVLRWLEGEPISCGLPYGHLIESAQQAIVKQCQHTADVIIATARYQFIEQTVTLAIRQKGSEKKSLFNLDHIACHRYFGLPVFFAVMYGLFFFAINIGGIFQEYFEAGSHAIFVEGTEKLLSQWGAPPWLLASMVCGLGKGISTVLTFVPVLGAMFLALAFLEDCGYMARAAVVMDRFMRAVGLPGKSFVPMIVGFGCNVPAILGTRTLDNKRDRILAVMMSPFMSCGARLAIFTVFVAAFFPQGGQNIVFLLYLIGIAMAILTGLLLKKTLLKGELAPLLLEMPPMQWPHWQSLWMHCWHRLKKFILNAGKVILPVCLVIGLLNGITPEGKWINEPSTQNSALAVIGQEITPLFKPMGIEQDNWPAVVGLFTGILAKEVVIGTLNSLYLSPNADADFGEMVERFNGRANAFAYLLFVLLYFPCISATAAMVREVQKGWTLFSVLWTTSLAYAIAVSYYQCATFMAHPWQSMGWIGSWLTVCGLSWFGMRYYSRHYLPRVLPTPIILKLS